MRGAKLSPRSYPEASSSRAWRPIRSFEGCLALLLVGLLCLLYFKKKRLKWLKIVLFKGKIVSM